MFLFVQINGGRTITVSVGAEETVAAIQAELERKEGIPPEQQTLKFGGKVLANHTGILECGLRKDATLQMSFSLRGGGNPLMIYFEFNSLFAVRKRNFDENAPIYRRIRGGISFKSQCEKSTCAAFSHFIYVTIGYGYFNIAEESLKLNCPLCTTRAKQARNCGFYMAKWRFEGVDQKGRREVSEGVAAEQQYFEFKESDSKEWRYLRQ